MGDQILLIASDLISVFFCLFLYAKMLALKKDTKTQRFIMYGGCSIVVGLFVYATYIKQVPASLSTLFCMTLPSFFLFLYLSKYRGSRFILTFCLIDTTVLIVAFISRLVGILTTGGHKFVVLTMLVLFLGFYFFGHKHFKSYYMMLEVEGAGWTSMAISAVLIYFALIFFAAYPKPLVERTEYSVQWLVFAAVVISCYVVFVESIIKTWKISKKNEQLEREKRFYHIAYTDALTGLFNRASYIDKVGRLNTELDQHNRICCVVMDLNNLKQTNDTFGHAVGDSYILAVSSALTNAFQQHLNYVFRVGGDEFFSILLDTYENEVANYLDYFKSELEKDSERLGISISVAIGYEFVKGSKDTVELTFDRADKKMYSNKVKMKEAMRVQSKD